MCQRLFNDNLTLNDDNLAEIMPFLRDFLLEASMKKPHNKLIDNLL